MADLTYKEAQAANELVASSPGAGQEQITGAEVVGATSATNVDSGWTFISLKNWVLADPNVMLKSEYDSSPTNGIVNAAGSVETDLGAAKTAQQIVDHLDDLAVHRVLNDAQTTTTNLWSASKINSELATKASNTALTNHTGNTNNPHSTLHSQLSDVTLNKTHAQIDAHINDTTGNPHDVNHTEMTDGGVNTHAQIDTHLASDQNPHGVTHAQLPDRGNNSHLQIDNHINSNTNPHGVTAEQAQAAPITHVGDTSHLSTDERNAFTNASPALSAANPVATVENLVDLLYDTNPVIRREYLNFTGAGVDVVDNDGASPPRTDIIIAGGGGGSKHVIQWNEVSQPDQINLNFKGTGVTVADNPGNNSTDVTITGGAGGGDVSGPGPGGSTIGELTAWVDGDGTEIANAGYSMPAAGNAGQVLTKNSINDYDWSWQDPPAAGDVSGPATNDDNALAIWDGDNSKTLRNGAVLEADVIARTVANQYASLAQKSTPVDDDLLLLEDFQDSGNKKKLRIADIPGGSGGGVPEAPTDGQNYVRNGLTGSWNRGLRVFAGAADPAGNANAGDIWMDPN